MGKSETLLKIDELRDRYMNGDTSVTDDLYISVRDYCMPHIRRMVSKYKVDGAADDIAQELMIFLADGGIEKYQKGAASFAVYCSNVAENKTLKWIRSYLNRYKKELSITFDSEEKEDGDFLQEEAKLPDLETFDTPEKHYMNRELRDEIHEVLILYLKCLLSQGAKPYMTVGVGYSIVLYALMHPNTKTLSSPQWAFDKMQEFTVQHNADCFLDTLNDIYRDLELVWSDEFLDNMEEKYKDTGLYICDLIFGEHFVTKDIENWTSRYRQKMKVEVAQKYMELEL